MAVPAPVRGVVYMVGFVGLFAALVAGALRLDPWIGFSLPAVPVAVAAALVLVGAGLGSWCGALFMGRGRGTPAPFDPPTRFVAVGPYRWVRNPMYVGGLGLLAGAALWLRSPGVLMLAALAGVAAHLFVVGVEEPALLRRFGASYDAYRRSVRRWMPRPPR